MPGQHKQPLEEQIPMPDPTYHPASSLEAAPTTANLAPAQPETGPPPGFEGMQSLEKPDVALPRPPAGYEPGPTSVYSMKGQDSMLFKIGAVLASYGEKIPVQMQLKMAEQDMQIKSDTNKRAWDNYYANMATMRDLQAEHNRDASKALFHILPHMQNELSKIVNPDDRMKMAEQMAIYADGLQKGGGNLVRLYGKNMSQIFAMQDMIADPVYGPKVKERIASQGWFEWASTKEAQQIATNINTDRFPLFAGQLPGPFQQKLLAGNVDEAEFKTEYKKVLLHQVGQGMVRQEGLAAAMEHLNTDIGRQQMSKAGVLTDELHYKQQAKHKEASLKDRLQEEEITQAKERIKIAEKYPNAFPLEQLQQDKEDIRVAAGLDKSETKFSENNPVGLALLDVTAGKWNNPMKMLESAKAQGPAAYKQALGWYNTALEKANAAKAQGSSDVKQSEPGDTTGYYDLEHFNTTGKLKALKGEFSKRDLLTNPKYGKISDKARDEIQSYQLVRENSKNIFEAAQKAYTAQNFLHKLPEAWAESILLKAASNPNDAALLADPMLIKAKELYPELNDYLSAREAVLGKFARSVSGEVGVLTDQDVGRVRNLFGVKGDTAATLKSKEKALNRLLALNDQFMKESITGIDAAELRTSKKYQSTKEGIFGSVSDKSSVKSTTNEGVDKLFKDITGTKP